MGLQYNDVQRHAYCWQGPCGTLELRVFWLQNQTVPMKLSAESRQQHLAVCACRALEDPLWVCDG